MTHPAQSISAIIFDCDGVLVDSEVLAFEVEHAMLAEIGLVYDPVEYKRRFLGLPYNTYLPMIAADVRERTGRDLPADYDARLSAALRSTYAARLAAIEGAHACVHSLTLPRAVASSSKLKPLHWKLEKTGLKPAFGEHIYSAEHVTHGKPAPDLFMLAGERLGAPFASTLVIEDAVNGILAAKAAGMIAAGFCGGGHCAPDHGEMLEAAGADLLFANFAELSHYLAPV